MKTKLLAHVSCLAVLILGGSVALGNNNLFLPGDAFFPTVLTLNDIEAIQKAKVGERTFTYSSFDGYDGAFCGYAGYARANISAVDDAFSENLATVYKRHREYQPRQLIEKTEDDQTELIETNGIRVLFYPPDFEFPRHHFGLRYNENWVAEAVKFGHPKKHLRLCCLIPSASAMEHEWRDADEVPPLKVKLPDIKLKPVPETETPVVVQGPVKAIMIRSHSLEELFHNKNDHATMYIVDAKGIALLGRDEDGKWTEFRD